MGIRKSNRFKKEVILFNQTGMKKQDLSSIVFDKTE